jgi:hypothetical protein
MPRPGKRAVGCPRMRPRDLYHGTEQDEAECWPSDHEIVCKRPAYMLDHADKEAVFHGSITESQEVNPAFRL